MSEPVADEEAPAAPPERAERTGLLAAVRSVVSKLEPRQRAEVKVSFGVLELEADELEAIAVARSASIEAVQAELHALADEVERRREVAESDATHSYARLSSLHRRLELARTALLHARSDPSAPAPGRRPTTTNTIARLTHEQLTVEIEQLGVDLERVASSLSDDSKRAKDPFAGRADRRRIAVLLGAVAADAPAKELDRAGNTVWTRSRRVVEALRRSLESRREP